MSIASMLNSAVTVARVTKTPDDFGSWTESEDDLIVDLPFRLQALSGSERQLYGKLQVEANYKGFCLPQTEEIREADVIYYGTRKFDVLFVDDWNLEGRYLRLFLRERK
jgi:predicted nucleotidyltransferase